MFPTFRERFGKFPIPRYNFPGDSIVLIQRINNLFRSRIIRRILLPAEREFLQNSNFQRVAFKKLPSFFAINSEKFFQQLRAKIVRNTCETMNVHTVGEEKKKKEKHEAFLKASKSRLSRTAHLH